MKILVLNAGSSSLKYKLIDMEGEKDLALGQVTRIGNDGSKIEQKAEEKAFEAIIPMKDHTDAIEWMLKALLDPEKGALKSMDEIGAVGHRVLHGGEKFTASVLIDEQVKEAIRDNIPLGPLHNPANLMGIDACEKIMKGTPNVAVFDTAFHQTMPPKSYLYGVPYEYYERLHVRRYGFHGTSHRYVSKRCIQFLGLEELGSKIIVCHLGNGSSLCAVKDGKCFDTSMGIAPLEGVLMGTRCGNLDATVVQYLANNEKLTVDEVLDILNKKSGLLGVSGVSNDMRDVLKGITEGKQRCVYARDMMVYSVQKQIGAYIASLGGIDAIVFTAGIGENNAALRKLIMEPFTFMGIQVDQSRNESKQQGDRIISTDDSTTKVLVIPTNEEIMIARDTLCIVSGKPVE